VARGRALFASHDCARCHDPASSLEASVPLANLAERYDLDALSDFLAVPPPAMPTPALHATERRALASYLLSRVES
jgi:mono/diheme cytochrome c family protein